MSASTVLHEERTAIRESGIQKYQVVVVCSDAGELPDAGLFVYQIVDQADALQDVFVRVSEIVDFSPDLGYLNSRLAATIAGATYWRSSVLTKLYDDIDVANSAVQAIFDRVNTLVNDYMVYNASFQTPGEDIAFPTTDPTQVQVLKDAYATAYTSYETAQTAQTTAEDDLATAQADMQAQQTELQHWLDLRKKFQEESGNDQQAMADAYANFNGFVSGANGNALQTVGALDAFLASYQGKFGTNTRKLSLAPGSPYTPCEPSDIGKTVEQATTGHKGTLLSFSNESFSWWVAPQDPTYTFADILYTVSIPTGSPATGTLASPSVLIGAGPVDPEVAALRTARNSFDAARQQALNGVAASSAGVSHHGTTTAYIGDQVTQHSSAVLLAQTTVTDYQIAYNEAQGNAQTAYTALEQAYNDVMAVCPNWSPTPPFPPVPA